MAINQPWLKNLTARPPAGMCWLGCLPGCCCCCCSLRLPPCLRQRCAAAPVPKARQPCRRRYYASICLLQLAVLTPCHSAAADSPRAPTTERNTESCAACAAPCRCLPRPEPSRRGAPSWGTGRGDQSWVPGNWQRPPLLRWRAHTPAAGREGVRREPGRPHAASPRPAGCRTLSRFARCTGTLCPPCSFLQQPRRLPPLLSGHRQCTPAATVTGQLAPSSRTSMMSLGSNLQQQNRQISAPQGDAAPRLARAGPPLTWAAWLLLQCLSRPS